jgi:hypothetical protein
MLIRSIEARSYRTIRHAKVELGPGLNVIHGENDIGKSTLVDALLSAFMWRGRISGTRLEAMRSHHGGQPEVLVTFDHQGAEYELHKRFATNGSTSLRRRAAGGVAREVADPDDALIQILGMGERTAKGRPSDLGLLPLLWVTQGAAGTAPHEVVSGAPSVALSERLAELSGAAVAGAGAEHVLGRVTAEYERHFQSRAGGKKKGAPASLAAEELEQANAEVRDLRVHRDQLQSTFEARLARERDHRAVLARLPALVEEAKRMQDRWEEFQALLARRATAEAEVRARQLAAQAARGKLEGRRALRDQIAALGERLTTEVAAAHDAEGRLHTHDAGRADLAEREATAANAERTADAELRAARTLVDALADEGALADLATRLATAAGSQQSLVDLHGKLGALRLRPADLTHLEKLERAAENAGVVLEAAAAGLQIVALQEGSIAVDGEVRAVQAGDRLSHRVACPMTVRIGDAAEIVIHPGGQDLATAREAARAKQAAFERALAVASVASLGEVRAAVEDWRAVEREIAVAKAQLEAVASGGFELLQQQHATQRARVEAVAAARHGHEAIGADQARAHAAAAERQHQQAREIWEVARASLAGHDARRAELNTALGVAQAHAAGSQRRHAELQAALAEAVAVEGSEQALAERYGEVETRAAQAVTVFEALDARLAGQDRDVVQQRAHGAARARETALDERARLEKEIHGLDARLDQDDSIDLDERLDVAAVRLERAGKVHARREEEADGVRLLHEILCACRNEARTRFQGPLLHEVERLAHLLDPTAKVELDASYGVTLERAVFGTHAFESLGGGCKEQLATVVRLGMAKVLAGDDTLPVLFDDAMVNTSDARFERMGDVLLAMAAQLQIIVFTCHWDRYARLGAHRVIDLGRVRGELEGWAVAAE